MTDFDFTEEELRSNKNGVLSPRQKAVLKATASGIRTSSKSGVWVILFFAALGVCMIVALFLRSMDTRRLQVLGPQLLIGLCIALLAVFIVTILGILISRRMADKLEAAVLFSAEGIIAHDSDYSAESGIKSYYVYFGKKRFAFAEDMSRIFPKGATFRVFYCKAGQIELIQSFEKLL